MNDKSNKTDYAASGVDISRGTDAVNRMKKHINKTHTPDVLKGVGAFAGVMSAQAFKNLDDPVILASVDGVGTKTVVAEMSGQWDYVGHDIVNHSGNDLVCQGGKPLLFLDYIASSRLDPEIIERIVKGMSEACVEQGCVLLGGETAEMPKVYTEGAHDIVGAVVGVCDKAKMITGETIQEGDVCIGLASNGLHTNGYSLARKVLIDDAQFDVMEKRDDLDGDSIADALLKPHVSYVKTVLDIHDAIGIKGIAHITGGGIIGNLSRILPEGLGAEISLKDVQRPKIFDLIQQTGNIDFDAMIEAFNCGVGMILVVNESDADAVIKKSNGFKIGSIVKGNITVKS